MSERRRDAIELRIELARGHWELEERAEAVACLERLAGQAPSHAALAECVERFCADPAVRADAGLGRRLAELRERVAVRAPEAAEPGPSSLATSTLAELLAEQGHTRRALEVAEEVLRRNPDDARARAVRRRAAGSDAPSGPRVEAHIERLQLWLRRLKRRSREVTA